MGICLESLVSSSKFPELAVNTALFTMSCFQVPAMVTESISSMSTTTEGQQNTSTLLGGSLYSISLPYA